MLINNLLPRRLLLRLRRLWSKFGFLAGILVLCIFSLSILFFLNSRYVARFGGTVDLESEIEEVITPVESTAPQTVDAVLANYRAALGREADLKLVQSMRLAGIMRNNEGTFPVQLTRRAAGDHLHLTLYNRREPRTFIWRPNSITLLDQHGEEQPFDDPYLTDRFALDAWLFFLPLNPSPQLPLLYVGRESFRGFDYDILETGPGTPFPARFYFEATTGLLRFRELPAFAEHPSELDEYLEYRRIDGIRVPFRVLYMRDGEYEGDFAATRVEFNPGMLR